MRGRLVRGTLFIAERSHDDWRRWTPLGRLDLDLARPWYRFRHVKGAERAEELGILLPVPGFGKLFRDYQSEHLFPVFQNRVMNRRRPDLPDYLKGMDLSPSVDPIHALWVDGGYRVTDRLNVFPKLTRGEDGWFRCRFFLHRSRHANAAARHRLEVLKPGETLHLSPELPENPAVAIYTRDRQLVGWTPMFLAREIALASPAAHYEARVVRVNPAPRPSSHRVLVEARCMWENHEPMSSEDFEPLVQAMPTNEPRAGRLASPTAGAPSVRRRDTERSSARDSLDNAVAEVRALARRHSDTDGKGGGHLHRRAAG